MARDYTRISYEELASEEKAGAFLQSSLYGLAGAGLAGLPFVGGLDPNVLAALSALPAFAFFNGGKTFAKQMWLEQERNAESARRGGNPVLGAYPQRDAFARALEDCQGQGKSIIDKYLVGYELATGAPLWLKDDAICSHGCVFAKTGVGKTLWMESLIFQQMARGRASGLTFIDAKRDSGTLAHIILMALLTGRIEDLVVIDPFDAVHSYNFVMTNQRADVKARKVLRAGLPPTSDQSSTKHYDRLAADSIYRMVRAMESFGLNWTIQDMAVALSAFNLAYPQLRNMLNKIGARKAMVELGHLASSYRTGSGKLDTSRITDNLRGISSELHAISGSDMGGIFCTEYTDLVLTDAILRGKIVYFMLPRLEEAESAARMVKLFREDLEVSIGEITSSRHMNLEDPHLVVIDEGASTFGPSWANLFELARKGRFALLFGAQSTGGLTDKQMGLSEAFYERVMANVNLKVMMRIGDNRTAEDMAGWFGKVATTKRSVGAGVMSSGAAPNLMSGLLGRESQTINIQEDEEDLVSAEELKHEMSAEKGLAWFDMGDGRVVKGRSFWVDSDIPDTWEGREFIPTFEKFEKDGLGLSQWVDERILNQEEQETSPQFATDKPEGKRPGAPQSNGAQQQRQQAPAAPQPQQTAKAAQPQPQQQQAPQEENSGPLKFGDVGKRGRFRRGVVNAFTAATGQKKEEKPKGPPRPKLRFRK